ncbi:MAG TPA: hypothetical protein VF245_12835 [Solirubrobacterales bacterium]
MPLPRDTCPLCGKSVPVRVNGALREHTDESGEKCAGSGNSVAELEEAKRDG